MASNVTDGRSIYSGVQETQPPGIGSTGSYHFTQTTTLGNTGPCTEFNILTTGGALKVLLIGRVFLLDSGGNERSSVVPDADCNLCAYCGVSTNQ